MQAWSRVRGIVPHLLAFLACALVAMIVAFPVVVERAIESVRFSDRLGTLPVDVRLCHNGRSTLDTGMLGKVYYRQTGPLGFGAYARATGPPEAGGTLASYVDPTFVQANVTLISEPQTVVDAYAAEFEAGLRDRIVRNSLLAGVIGGAVLFAVLPRRRIAEGPVRSQVVVAGLLVVVATGASTAIAFSMFREWPCDVEVTRDYVMPDFDRLSFDNPETLEVARQVQPFIDKNNERTDARAAAYERTARTSFVAELTDHAAALAPREGEQLIVAEADTQGSNVGVAVRKGMYAEIADQLGEDAVTLRTISGDVSSNGTVAEASYIADEAAVSGPVPTVAVGGDHDSETTWQQMRDNGIEVPDNETVEIDGLRVSVANDSEHKTLFGGLVTNESGISEQELGANLRESLDEDPRIVLLHQPDAATGYLGVDLEDDVETLDGSLTVPYDDGVPDQIPGTVNIGHKHESNGPWVLWNTDGDEITWTVVDQLGTAGGVENSPTINRFSTPDSVPLKPITVRLQYFDSESGLQTGYATVQWDLDGACTITERVDVGLPGGQPIENPDPTTDR